MTHTWTVDSIMRHRPGDPYTRDYVEALFAGRDRLTVLDILDLDIPGKDRMWVVLTEGDHVAPAMERIVARAVRAHALTCGVPEVEQWAERWLIGEDRSARSARAAVETAKAAWADAWMSADAVAWVAAWSAWAEAIAAGWAAATAAASLAAAPLAAASVEMSEEAVEAAKASEFDRQLDDVRAVVKGDA